ncbi:hypothetical protein AX15_007862 [Amanita polypyramis BW_CC]|nr:hypothetical protein AX15_007862 [Amanita polypyramis BW_CC]
MSHPPTPSPVVSSQGVIQTPRGWLKTALKPIGRAHVVANTTPLLDPDTYFRSEPTPSQFLNPDKPLATPNTIIPGKVKVQDNAYYNALGDALVAPSQDDIKEHQTSIANIYQIIKKKLEDEEDIFLASDAEANNKKWNPLAPDANIPPADVIDQDWARSHSHAEFLREQSQLNNLAAAVWHTYWMASCPNLAWDVAIGMGLACHTQTHIGDGFSQPMPIPT